jgi:hypothetical protein
MGLPFSFLPMMMRPSQRPSARLLTLPSPLALRFAIWTHLPFCFVNTTLYHRRPEYPAKDPHDTEIYQFPFSFLIVLIFIVGSSRKSFLFVLRTNS